MSSTECVVALSDGRILGRRSLILRVTSVNWVLEGRRRLLVDRVLVLKCTRITCTSLARKH